MFQQSYFLHPDEMHLRKFFFFSDKNTFYYHFLIALENDICLKRCYALLQMEITLYRFATFYKTESVIKRKQKQTQNIYVVC